VRALHEGWIAGAALDAFITEPLPATHPLVTAPNLLITPHQASFGLTPAHESAKPPPVPSWSVTLAALRSGS
jgi:phosphoglycerate dehydrogenase-like enzyme